MNLLDWLGVTSSWRPLEIGDAAPDAVSRDEQGNDVRLADLYGDGFTLVYFYPKAGTSGCTAQACSLRDGFALLRERGVRIVGVSADGTDAQRLFAEKHRLPFVLLADREHVVAKAFGVPLLLGMTRRQSFLIKNRLVVWRDLRASTTGQARDVLKALDHLG